MKTGDLRDGGRWCEACDCWHGPLYVCETYPPDLRAEVQAQSDRYIANLQDPKWVAEQLANGATRAEITILRWFAGVPDGNSAGNVPDVPDSSAKK